MGDFSREVGALSSPKIVIIPPMLQFLQCKGESIQQLTRYFGTYRHRSCYFNIRIIIYTNMSRFPILNSYLLHPIICIFLRILKRKTITLKPIFKLILIFFLYSWKIVFNNMLYRIFKYVL